MTRAKGAAAAHLRAGRQKKIGPFENGPIFGLKMRSFLIFFSSFSSIFLCFLEGQRFSEAENRLIFRSENPGLAKMLRPSVFLA